MVAGCGGTSAPIEAPAAPSMPSAPEAPSAPPERTATPPPPTEAAAGKQLDEAAQKREQLAAKALEVMRGEDVDDAQAGKMAAAELSEADYALPSEIAKGLGAIVSSRVDPSQRMMIIAAILHEPPTPAALERACSPAYIKLLERMLREGPSLDLTSQIVETCKADEAVAGRDGATLHPLTVLLTVGVLELLAAPNRGPRTPSEVELARYLLQFPLSE